jgi:hypothetical protein
MQKVHVENFSRENSQKIDKNLDVSFSSTFSVLLRFQVLLGDGSSKALPKTFYKKNRVEKFLQKNRQKIQNRFFLDFFYHVFGRFSVRGVEKHDKKISPKNLTNPGTVLASEEPTNHPKARHFFLSANP